MDEKFYTPYSREEILTAFRRALGDLTDTQVFALVADEAEQRAAEDDVLSDAIAAINADLAANYVRSFALDAETAARTAADQQQCAALTGLIDSGAKNVLDLTNAQSVTVNGVTFTVNSDCSVTCTGQAAATAFFSTAVTVPAGQYVFSGMPEDGSAATYRQELRVTPTGNVFTTNESAAGSALTVANAWSGYFNIRVAAGYDFGSGKTLHPMICTAAATNISRAYVPYRPSWDEMWAAIRALQQTVGVSLRTAPETEANHA